MDREFLGKSVIPYHQFFRADMPEPNTGPDQKLYDFNLSQLQVSQSLSCNRKHNLGHKTFLSLYIYIFFITVVDFCSLSVYRLPPGACQDL